MIIDLAEKIERECFDNPWSAASLAETAGKQDAVFILEERNGNAAGYVLGCISHDECELYRIAVLPEYRRSGIASVLIAKFVKECKNRGVNRILLEVKSKNTGAVGLYEKHGFKTISVRKNYYLDDDALIFELVICRHRTV